MTRHLWRESVVTKRPTDGARGGVESVGEGFVGCYAARGDLAEEGVDALVSVG